MMNPDKNITAFIIAGGESKRFGRDKLLYEYRGKLLIAHVVDSLSEVFSEIAIIANDRAKFSSLGLPVYPDIIPGLGPIGGIYTALSNSTTGKAFCFAGDMPNIDPGLIRYMIDISGNYDIVVPYINNYYEALHAIYSSGCLNNIRDGISRSDYKIINLYNNLSTRKIEQAEIEKHSSVRDLFKNINYIDDIK